MIFIEIDLFVPLFINKSSLLLLLLLLHLLIIAFIIIALLIHNKIQSHLIYYIILVWSEKAYIINIPILSILDFNNNFYEKTV